MAIVKRDRNAPAKKKTRDKDAEVVQKLDLSLPDEATEPEDDLWKSLILIFGEKKIGKTELLAQVPNAIFLATEVGYKGLRIFKRDVTSWKEAKGYAKLLKKDKQYKLVVIDIADILYDLCFVYVCEKMMIDHPNDEAFGKAWYEIKKEFESLFLSLAQTGKGVALISHAEEKEVKMRDGDTYDRIMPTMSKQARKVIEGMVDVWACYQYEGRRRVLTIAGDDHVAAGHRFGERFRTPDGRPLRHIDMGRTAQEGYRNLMLAWDNKYTPKEESDADPLPKKKSKFKLRIKR
jgi:hypothetical protein